MEMCGRCYAEAELFPANCFEKPELLGGMPLGMYHCPDCGAMIVAGVPHPPLCKVCIDRKHPGFDVQCHQCFDTGLINDHDFCKCDAGIEQAGKALIKAFGDNTTTATITGEGVIYGDGQGATDCGEVED